MAGRRLSPGGCSERSRWATYLPPLAGDEHSSARDLVELRLRRCHSGCAATAIVVRHRCRCSAAAPRATPTAPAGSTTARRACSHADPATWVRPACQSLMGSTPVASSACATLRFVSRTYRGRHRRWPIRTGPGTGVAISRAGPLAERFGNADMQQGAVPDAFASPARFEGPAALFVAGATRGVQLSVPRVRRVASDVQAARAMRNARPPTGVRDARDGRSMSPFRPNAR
ncbi:MAG: hypothetical protein JWO02_3826 [Solirubrobacterales bacterium]|nr:hypothetical protein [Solirubrobacterales bacterium]